MKDLSFISKLSNEALLRRLLDDTFNDGRFGNTLPDDVRKSNEENLDALRREVLKRLEEGEELKACSKPSFSGIPYKVALEAGMITTEMREFEDL
jgi:hypothetical protein